jgi:hypothetical protein
LQGRGPAGPPDGIAPGEKARSRSEPHQQPRGDRDLQPRSNQRERVRDRDDRKRAQTNATRAVAVDQPASRYLSEKVGEEERGREQADDRETDAVRVGELTGDRARVGDVPRDREPEREPAEDR